MTSIGSGNIQSEFQYSHERNNKNISAIKFNQILDNVQFVEQDSFKRNVLDGVWIQDIKASSYPQGDLGSDNKDDVGCNDIVFSDDHLDSLNYYVKDGCFYVDKFNFEGVYSSGALCDFIQQAFTKMQRHNYMYTYHFSFQSPPMDMFFVDEGETTGLFTIKILLKDLELVNLFKEHMLDLKRLLKKKFGEDVTIILSVDGEDLDVDDEGLQCVYIRFPR